MKSHCRLFILRLNVHTPVKSLQGYKLRSLNMPCGSRLTWISAMKRDATSRIATLVGAQRRTLLPDPDSTSSKATMVEVLPVPCQCVRW
eukprot:452636-Pelagomonas_calceolata.AAC.2